MSQVARYQTHQRLNLLAVDVYSDAHAFTPL